MRVTQHPTAIISPQAQLGQNIEIGAYSIIGDNVTISDNVKIHSHVVIDGHTRIGSGCELFPFAAIGLAPQREPNDLGLATIQDHARLRERDARCHLHCIDLPIYALVLYRDAAHRHLFRDT